MGKFTFRIGLGGCAVALFLFVLHRFGGPSGELPIWQSVFWPTSMLLGKLPATPRVGLSVWVAVAFAALMNGAAYFGCAWALWWIARLAGWLRNPVREKDRFVSIFLGIGLGFALLVTLGEAAVHGVPRPGSSERYSLYLVAANLFALIVITCLTAAWILWWLRGWYGRRAARRTSI